ncbi:hypothetical protein CspeluHIS016_0307350 [Cutaneotrichosporon spelunceum]|uniref:UDP-N-acetylglucosamine--dolichyl-phosphate N-acetylglucosaminephosphotransferase n=1 Tax=Cutaneotrichosporon spelunceum TaxID=1672016 RepID=A0AAD3TU08_9TREE|nr:hypothetical protein CspeluHIS016_0307350 [Cutaneotrichosporon spelunceum]
MPEPAAQMGRPLPVLLIRTLVPIALTLILHPLIPVLGLTEYFPFPPQPTFPALQANIGFALLALVGALYLVPKVSPAFIDKGLKGRDLLKPGGRTSGPWVPECLGLPCATLYLLLMMLFIPFPFSHIFQVAGNNGVGREKFPLRELTFYLTSLLSLLTATLLGFIDDLFDIRWRHKLPIPLIAAVPTLLVYYATGGWTWVVLPESVGKLLRSLGLPGWTGAPVVNLRFLYYVYLALLPTFTTNSINILAGINGVETIQPLIIAMSITLNDLLYLPIWPEWFLEFLGIENAAGGRILTWAVGQVVTRHLMSLYFMIPLIGVCAGFLWHNWYTARAFPGDTLCYFTGMAFSAVAIQGHFAKTMLLFFLPQIFNFLLSCPQLFRLVPCPRHRLPHFNEATGLLEPSKAVFERAPPLPGRIFLEVFQALGLTRLERAPPPADSKSEEVASSKSWPQEGDIVSATNLTLLNYLLVRLGPMHEPTLCLLVGAVQVAGSAVAFAIRYGVGSLVYGGDRR